MSGLNDDKSLRAWAEDRLSLPDDKVDNGGNLPGDYISVEDWEAAEKTLKEKTEWFSLTKNEIVVVRDMLREKGLRKDLVFADRLALIRCILEHAWTKK